MANLKRGVSKKQSTQNFPKNEHFLPPVTHTHVVTHTREMFKPKNLENAPVQALTQLHH